MEVFGGTAGWSYPDWRGPFYPKKMERGFSELKFYSNFFDCVEVNSTFYRHFPRSAAEKWLFEVKSNPDFVFIIKLFQQFTHGSYEKDQLFHRNKSAVTELISPLREQNKLGGILVQFSEFYRESPRAREHLCTLKEAFHDYPLFFELRHASWYTSDAMEFLILNEFNIVAIDQPQLEGLAGFVPEVMGNIGYARFHGRNVEMWDAGRQNLREGINSEDRNSRYNYLYSSSELDELEEKLRKAKLKCERTYLIMNNHPLGKAVVNALELLRRMREQEKVRVPDTIIKYFPEIGKIADRVDVSPIGDLFE